MISNQMIPKFNQNEIPLKSGSYVLFISLMKEVIIEIGSLGEIKFPKGIYLYIGSACGPGGLNKRVNRHLAENKKIFWHIDYLLQNSKTEIMGFAWILSERKNECKIVEKIKNSLISNQFSQIKKFGSSDCNCYGHLIFLKSLSLNETKEQITNIFSNLQLIIL
ncbi:MAG TPA: GIY-YIG nuclease family protein [candidate division Zixibacteria bacterium]|nr:GIY-YIG nuclease family protein [candidate division Zixibacteria bacterium]